MNLSGPFWKISTASAFEKIAWETFSYQYENNPTYRAYCHLINVAPEDCKELTDIPFLPVELFKSHQIRSSSAPITHEFRSSGTSSTQTSKHLLSDISAYEKSFSEGFKLFYGDPTDWVILALLPSYLEREDSSLVYMAQKLMEDSGQPENGFYLDQLAALRSKLQQLALRQQKVLLLGVSFALLDLAALGPLSLPQTVIMETGGMKGRRKEIIREELHQILKSAFGVEGIHSEYGMTELLSQAYSSGQGLFECPPWMRVLGRSTEDPLSTGGLKQQVGLNIIDLANQQSCAFIATQDLGRIYPNGSFEVLGRFDAADVRGCNLMVL
ncbi:MAG: acyl transferase [Flavobacteriaceae bacterium]